MPIEYSRLYIPHIQSDTIRLERSQEQANAYASMYGTYSKQQEIERKELQDMLIRMEEERKEIQRIKKIKRNSLLEYARKTKKQTIKIQWLTHSVDYKIKKEHGDILIKTQSFGWLRLCALDLSNYISVDNIIFI